MGKFPEDISELVVTPEVDHLLDASEMSVRLEEAEGRDSHGATTRLLFLCKRSRP